MHPGGELTLWKEKSNCNLPKDVKLRRPASSRRAFASARRAERSRAAPQSPPGPVGWERGAVREAAAPEHGVWPGVRPGAERGCSGLRQPRPQPAPDLGAPSVPLWERCPPPLAPPGNDASMEKSSSEDSSIHRSPSLDSKDSDFAKPSTSGRPFGRGFTAGAFYGTAGSRGQSRAEAGVKTDKYNAPKGSKYVVFYLDLSFVFLLEFKKCNMARGCLCCLKYMMFLFNLIFWVSPCVYLSFATSPLRASRSVLPSSSVVLHCPAFCTTVSVGFKKKNRPPPFIHLSLSEVAEWRLRLACLPGETYSTPRWLAKFAATSFPCQKPMLQVPPTGEPAEIGVGPEFLTAVTLS